MNYPGHWLTPGRAIFYARIILTIFIAAAVLSIFFAPAVEMVIGKPLENDFIVYWAASHLALGGHPVDAYDMQKLLAAGREGMPDMAEGFTWYYLPTFFLVILPLALLPYPMAYFAFMAATLPPYLAALQRAARPLRAGLFIGAYPGLWVNLNAGQNGFLTAALAGYSLLLLPKRPVSAGVFIGLLAIKPHLALLFPVALLAGRNWPTFWSAGVTTSLFLAFSTWVLGPATLAAALGSIGGAMQALEAGQLSWGKMPSLYAWLLHLGVAVPLAYLAHIALACVAAACVWIVWRRSQDACLRGAVLMTAGLMVSPFLYDYDLTWLAFPIAWLTVFGLRKGWLPGDREILLCAWITPLFMLTIAEHLNVQVCPLVLGALLWMIFRRVRSDAGRV